MQTLSSTPFYYGKNPSRGDFIKSKGQNALTQTIDQWITQALDVCIKSDDFSVRYNNLAPLDFFIANPQGKNFLVANLVASEDSSGRKFPMVLGQFLEVQSPLENMLYAPYAYKQVLLNLLRENISLRKVTNSTELLEHLADLNTQIEVFTAHGHTDFLDEHTVYSFAKLMNMTMAELAQMMIALGLLLQPVIQHGTGKLNKVLVIPIFNDTYKYEISAFWVGLINQFIGKQNTDVLIGVLHQESPVLLFGFQGTDIRALSDILIQDFSTSRWVALKDTAWIEQYLDQNIGLVRLKQALCDRQMSLRQGIKMFMQIFI
ncbi:type VI secretion system-associated protein TagF [Acinetobacter sp. ESL0695]|uniref:type VI secretion system-associated protein TagF n=1 Tax=Acinetobacter sp. ESL0695 TaxID=2983215 RepID=UPI0023F0BE51|nr:type VI secretion system-associated protein TagF [Acinetobacter sp. ESL0695]WEV49823.1 type VI secretion system-associated protein TagF [Acinetobacter sp. ESL0695]